MDPVIFSCSSNTPPLTAFRVGRVALTSTRIPAGATTELAHRQPNGTCLWTIDQPNVLGD